MLRRFARGLLHFIPVAIAGVAVGFGAMAGFAPPPGPLVPHVVTTDAAGAEPAASTVAGSWKDTGPRSPLSYAVADATGPIVHLYSAPDRPLAERPTMDNPTWEGLPVVFLVLDQQGPWLHVRVSMRPNGFTAWVARDEVSMRTVPNRVIVEVGARRVTVTHGDKVILQGPVGVGTDASPTPLGNFFVDGIVKVPNPNGPYGAYQVSVSGFSGVYETFGGGVGQIALHGTNHPELVGQGVSHGCVRMTNEMITMLAQLAPLGTPVDIVA